MKSRSIVIECFCHEGFDGEIDFWKRLDGELRSRGIELILIAHSFDLRIEGLNLLPFAGSDHMFTSYRESNYEKPEGFSLHDEFKKYKKLLKLRKISTDSDVILKQKVAASRGLTEVLLSTCKPYLWITWNGNTPIQGVFKEVVKKAPSTRWAYLERSPVPGVLHFDELGLFADSALAKVSEVKGELVDTSEAKNWMGNETWWSQPEGGLSREQFLSERGLSEDTRVVLFAGQVDNDAQNYCYSPHFETNSEAFRWFLGELKQLVELGEDIYVLGKHHPKSDTRPEAYRQVISESGVKGEWNTKLGLDYCWEMSQVIASVNSSVNMEAFSKGLVPLFVGGLGVLGGWKSVFYVSPETENGEILRQWLSQEKQSCEEKKSQFSKFMTVATEQYYFQVKNADDSSTVFGSADQFAERLDQFAEKCEKVEEVGTEKIRSQLYSLSLLLRNSAVMLENRGMGMVWECKKIIKKVLRL